MKKAFGKFILMSVIAASLISVRADRILAAEDTEMPVDTEEVSEDIYSEEGEEGIMPIDEMTEGQPVQSAGIPMPNGNLVQSYIPDDAVPAKFTKISATYQGAEVEAAKFDNGDIVLLLVTDSAGGNGKFMQYKEATGELTAFIKLNGANDNYIIVLPASEALVVPEGFSEAPIGLGDGDSGLTGYVDLGSEAAPGSAMPSDFCLLYAVNSNGVEGLYSFDAAGEGTYQRYVSYGNASSANADKLIDFEAVKNGEKAAVVKLIIVAAMGLLILILLILVIILAVKLKDYADYEYIDEDVYRANMSSARAKGSYTGEIRMDGHNVQSGQNPAGGDNAARTENAPKTENRPFSQGNAKTSDRPVRAEATERQGRPAARPETPVRAGRPEQAGRQQVSDAARRRALLETTDIADLEDILNDPNLTSNLPLPSQIEKAVKQKAEEEAKKAAEAQAKEEAAKKASYEGMQVTVDNYDAGMPAAVDTEMIKRNTGNLPAQEIEEEADDYEARRESYLRDEEYRGNRYADPYEDDEDDDDEDYYLTREERKERKLLEKQRRREEREAEKDAKFMEKERKRAEKRRRRGYDDPEAMDWSQLQDEMKGSAPDSRRPVGYNEDSLPSYVRNDMHAGGGHSERPEYAEKMHDETPENAKRAAREPEYSEEERANAAADAVIAAARGRAVDEDRQAGYVSGAERHQQAARPVQRGASGMPAQPSRTGRPGAGVPMQNAVQNAPAQNYSQQAKPQTEDRPAAQFTQDLDEDFEFEFLNIRRPD